MNCREVREVADSFLCEELLTETNHEILRHLDSCPSCSAEIEARRRLRGAVRAAFNRAEDLQPSAEFVDRLREQLRQAAVPKHRSWTFAGRWLAIAAGLVLAASLTAALLFNESTAPDDALARDAIGDHWNCALKYRLIRTPVPLEQAAQSFDSAYRVLLSTPPDNVPTPEGPARVIERHSCEYDGRRFGHVILQYRGRVVSLLVTANDGGRSITSTARPHVIGRPTDGLSVVSVDGSRHAIVLVSDLGHKELTQLAGVVSLPLVERLGSVNLDRGKPAAWPFPRPVQELAWESDRRPDLVWLSREHAR